MTVNNRVEITPPGQTTVLNIQCGKILNECQIGKQ